MESIKRLQLIGMDSDRFYEILLEESISLTESDLGFVVECETDYPPFPNAQEEPEADQATQAPSQVAGATQAAEAPVASQYSPAPYFSPTTVGLRLRAMSEVKLGTALIGLASDKERSFHQNSPVFAQVQRDHQPYFGENVQLPLGHPPLGATMIVPLIFGPRLIGMVGLSRGKAYSQEQLNEWSVFFNQAAVHMCALQQNQARWTAEQAWMERKQIAFAAEQTRQKDIFLANMSHELRTPLNGIINMTKILKDTRLDEEQTEYLETVEQCGVQLLAIVNDVIDYSKITSQKMTLAQQPVWLRQCLEDSTEMVNLKAQDKGLSVCFNIDPDVPSMIKGDAKRIRQILINLLENAVKFSNHGQIIISVVARPMQVEAPNVYEIEFSVQDSGIGISLEEQSKIFDSFSQVGSEYSQSQGSGLGLSISKQLAELMGGHMWVESQVGVGSIFHFTIVAEEFVDLQALKQTGSQLFRGRSVLIVDDNTTNRLVLFNLVLSWEMSPALASSLEEAMMFVKSRTFDMGFIDIRMPRPARYSQPVSTQLQVYSTTEEGVRLARRIREYGATFPLIAISSIGVTFQGDSLFAARLSKPVREKRLLEVCKAILFGSQPDPKPACVTPQSELSILIAEDQLTNQKVMGSMLNKLGYTHYDLVNSGSEAIRKIEERRKAGQHYDAILLDIRMPQLNGFQVAERVVQLYPIRRDRPFLIAVTAAVLEQDKEECRRRSFNGYLEKPINSTELATMLEVIADRRRKHATPPNLFI